MPSVPIIPIDDLEQGYSVRGKLNALIEQVNNLPGPLEVDDTLDITLNLVNQVLTAIIKSGAITEDKLEPALLDKINNGAGIPGTGTVTSVSAIAPLSVVGDPAISPQLKIDLATPIADGSMSAVDKQKLDSMGTNNTGDVTVVDTPTINLTLNAQELQANVIDGSIGGQHLDAALAAAVGQGVNAIPKSQITGKGVIITGTAANIPLSLPVGANGKVLQANSAAASGLVWGDLPAAGVPFITTLVDGADLNTVTTSGFYRIMNTVANGNLGSVNPPTHSMMLVIGNTDVVTQIIYNRLDANTWVRTGTGIGSAPVWGMWNAELSHNKNQLANISLNALKNSGFYTTNNTCTDTPYTGAWGHVLVHAVDGAQIYQEFSPLFVTTPIKYIRECSTNVWSPWSLVLAQSTGNVTTDLNTLTTSGNYNIIAGSANQPIAGIAGHLVVQGHANGDTHQEFIRGVTGNLERWERVRTIGSWFPWYKIFSSQGPNLVTAANAIGYDTGAGGAVNQAGAVTSNVTLNKPTGVIQLVSNTWNPGATIGFTLLNSLVFNPCVLSVFALDGRLTAVAGISGAGQASIWVTNQLGTAVTTALAIDFIIHKCAVN